MRLIGVLMGYAESDPDAQANVSAFRDSLQKLGWSEGHNIRIDTRWPIPADLGSMHRFAKELVALQPDVILSHITPAASWRAFRVQAVTSLASPVLSRRCPESGWSCSRRLRRVSLGSLFCSTQ